MRAVTKFTATLVISAASSAAMADVFSNYEELSEGFMGQTFAHNGVTYRDVNNVSGFYPDGEPFGPNDNGREVIVERASLFYIDFPTYGSPVNSLTFGTSYIPGDNLTIGALASVWMDLAEVGSGVSFDLAFYERGPWGGIQWRLEALRNGSVVGSDTLTIASGGDRDDPTFATMSISGVAMDQLHLYGWLNGHYTAPRGMIDNLTITAIPEPAGTGVLGGLSLLLARRRRCRSSCDGSMTCEQEGSADR
jgi:hypothetical protein